MGWNGARAGALVALLVAGTAGCSGSASTSTTTSGGGATTTTAVRNTTTDAAAPVVKTTFSTTQGQPLAEPPVLRSEDGVLETSFDVATDSFEVGGTKVKGIGYAGGLLGPTLVVSPGDTIRIDLQNGLDEETNFHTHGLHVSPEGISDNVLRVMEPESDNSVVIELPMDVAPGTYWYHAHLHGLTEPQVFSGLAGALEVTGPIGQLTPYIPAGYGFTAIIVAFLGRLHPVGVLIGALLMALLTLGGEALQISMSLPQSVSMLFQGLLLLFLLSADVLVNYRVV